jgi:hypothetical protein
LLTENEPIGKIIALPVARRPYGLVDHLTGSVVGPCVQWRCLTGNQGDHHQQHDGDAHDFVQVLGYLLLHRWSPNLALLN